MTVVSLKSAPSSLDLETYRRDGCIVVRGLLDTAVLDQINREMDDLFVLQLRRLGLPVNAAGTREAFLDNTTALLRADVATYISTARLTQMLPSAQALMVSEPVLATVKALGLGFPVISTRLSNHIMCDALKIPGGYHKSPAHQDWRSVQGSLDCVVLWAPTTPVTTRSHALEIVPGSHRLGLLSTAEHIMTPTVDDPRITDDQYRGLEMEPGDVAVFSSFLVHRTGEDGDGLVRIAFSARFNNAEEPTYVEHGYPTPYKYSYRTDLMFEGFPAPDDVARIFA